MPRGAFDQLDQIFALQLQRVQLAPQLHLLQPPQRPQPHVQDRLCLPVIQVKLGHHNRLWLILSTDNLDYAVKIEIRDDVPAKQFQSRVDFFQPVLRTADEDFDLVRQPRAQQFADAHHLRHTMRIKHIHVETKTRFEIGQPIQRILQIFGVNIAAFGNQNDANFGVALVADIIQDRQFFVGNQLRDLLDQLAFLHLIGDFADHQLPRAIG